MNENDALDQRLEAAVMDLHNRLNSNTLNGQTDFNPPKSYKPDMPVVKRMDVKSLFSGEGMPPLEDPQPNPPRLGAYFDTSLDFISGWTDPATTLPQNPGNVPPTPPPPAGCPTDGTVTLVLSGIVGCSCNGNNLVTTISADGTYTLTWNPTNNDFETSGVGSITIQAYSDLGCVTPDGPPITDTLSIQASCSGGLWTVAVFSTMVPGGGDAFFSASAVVAGAGANNSQVCSPTGGAYSGGGTATITV